MNENTNKLDQLKVRLEKRLGAMGEMRVSSPVLALMALLGLALVISGLWLSYKDLSGVRAFKRTSEQSEQSISQLSEIANQLQVLIHDPELQSLALQAVQQESGLDEVRAYAAGKISEVKDARVFAADLTALDPLTMGANGFALMEMLDQASQGINPPLQMHGSLQPPMLVEVTALRQNDELQGFIVLLVDPGFVLNRFTPDVSGSYPN
jgi:hypothetical protein